MSTSPGVRLDKWLWAARFFKTRPLAVAAIDGGKVRLNGERVKRARLVKPGDRLDIQLGPYAHAVVVRALSERRGPAAVAAGLYEETPESIAGREQVAFNLKAAHVLFVTDSQERPTKRDRRRLEEFRKRGDWD
jgi:ribosome-associated heat shock protein Hsp15